MKNKSIGLDMGAITIKLVGAAKDKNGIVLETALTVATPAKGMASESPLDQQEMADTIRDMMKDAKISTPYVNIALAENQVYTKVIEMPVLSDKELTSAIYWEAEQYIPVPLESVSLDWKVLRRPSQAVEGAKMDVLLVGAPTVLINKYQKILSLSGLMVNAVETEILAVIRAVAFESNFPNSIILHIGAVSTSLALIKDKVLVFTFPIATGGSALSRAIASDFGFSVTQAEEYKKIYGVSQNNFGGKIGTATYPILMSIVTEVKKAVAFYNEKFKDDSPIRQIVLSGGTAKLPGINSFFAQNCGLETIIANPWKALVSNQQLPKDVLDNAPDYTIALGLAMRDYE